MAIYGKTPLGTQAVETRTPPLPPRNRQILIMLDGRRDSAEFEKAFGAEAVAGILQSLVDAGLIESMAAPVQSASQASASASASATAATAAPPAATDPRLEEIRALLVDSTRGYTGPSGKALVQRLREAPDLPALLALRGEWTRTLAQNPLALEALAVLEQRLDSLLRGSP